IELAQDGFETIDLGSRLAKMLDEPGAYVGMVAESLDLPLEQLHGLDLDAVSVPEPGDEDVTRRFRPRENLVPQPAHAGNEALLVALAPETAARKIFLAHPSGQEECSGGRRSREQKNRPTGDVAGEIAESPGPAPRLVPALPRTSVRA